MNYTNIFDSHAHYDDKKFNADRDELLSSMESKGVSRIISCGCDKDTTEFNQKLSKKYPFLYYAAGFHPENLGDATDSDITSLIEENAADEKCVAVGEIGLDYYWMDKPKEDQIRAFEIQIKLAREYNLPIIVHDRDAHGDTLEILKKYKPKGVVHCFSGSKEMANDIINMGMYIGLNGVATFKNARKSLEVAKEIPIERLLLETDCPYLAPEPFRGKRNDSSLIPNIAERIGDLLNISAEKLLKITEENAFTLFDKVAR